MVQIGTTALTAEVEQWVSIVATSVDPVLVRKYVFAYLFPDPGERRVCGYQRWNDREDEEALIAMLDARVADTGFLAAGRFTFADALLLSTLAAVRLYPEGAGAIDAAPNLARYLDRHSARPSFVATDPWS